MSEQVKLSDGARKDIRRDAERNCEGATVADTLRLLDDYDALQCQVNELTSQRDAILLQARCWAGEAKAQQAITREVGAILGGIPDWGTIAAGVEELRSQLEAARGLLRTSREYVVQVLEDRMQALAGYPHKWQQEADDLAAIDAFLTATPAPEVRCQTCDGTGDVHRADGEWLGECHCVKAEQGERQEAVAIVEHSDYMTADEISGERPRRIAVRALQPEALKVGDRLYISPPPAQDVSGLVEALERAARQMWGSEANMDIEAAEIEQALATHRKQVGQ